MNILSVFLVGLGLSMDNFAVTLAAGGAQRHAPKRLMLQISVLFALAHFITFSGGWLLGTGVGHLIHAVDHWIAFVILAFIGVHMIYEAREAYGEKQFDSLAAFKTQLLLAAATSIDAWMVGLGLSFTNAPFWLTVGVMAGCVFATSWIGFGIGGWLGRKLGPVMEQVGGVILILIGVKLLIEGLGIW